MKKYVFLAASALALASCTSDDFLGDTPGSTPTSVNSAIKFDGDAGKISRATSNTASTTQGKLDYQFKIYGVKSGTDNKYSKVFENYNIWWNTTKTASNTNDWEYVADKGTISTGETATKTNIELSKKQTIKYWDYSSKDYHFVAGSPISAFEYTLNDNGDIKSATVSSLSGHITAKEKTAGSDYATEPNPVYVAEPVVVISDAYKKPVKFNFVRQQTKVRVGIYETIPGYSISSIKFYPYDDNKDAFSSTPSQNIVLTTTAAGYFKGGNSVSGKINYDWSEPTPKYTFEYETTGLTESKNWYGGKFAKVEATVSTETDKAKLYGTDGDMESTGYFTVLPTPSATDAQPILVKCDYTLTSDDGSKETINVKGATAAIPAAYSKWNTNTLYTYLFKISENTNGYTGSDDPGHVGLYPITFDAAVEAPQFGMQGTITTFTTPSITTYQAGSVTDDGIKYVTKEKIEVTVTESTSGTKKDLSTDNTATVGHIAVYKFDKDITEAEVQLKGVADKTAEKGSVTDNVFTFTPETAGWYVIQYLTTAAKTKPETPAVYTYKVVKVEAATATK